MNNIDGKNLNIDINFEDSKFIEKNAKLKDFIDRYRVYITLLISLTVTPFSLNATSTPNKIRSCKNELLHNSSFVDKFLKSNEHKSDYNDIISFYGYTPKTNAGVKNILMSIDLLKTKGVKDLYMLWKDNFNYETEGKFFKFINSFDINFYISYENFAAQIFMEMQKSLGSDLEKDILSIRVQQFENKFTTKPSFTGIRLIQKLSGESFDKLLSADISIVQNLKKIFGRKGFKKNSVNLIFFQVFAPQKIKRVARFLSLIGRSGVNELLSVNIINHIYDLDSDDFKKNINIFKSIELNFPCISLDITDIIYINSFISADYLLVNINNLKKIFNVLNISPTKKMIFSNLDVYFTPEELDGFLKLKSFFSIIPVDIDISNLKRFIKFLLNKNLLDDLLESSDIEFYKVLLFEHHTYFKSYVTNYKIIKNMLDVTLNLEKKNVLKTLLNSNMTSSNFADLFYSKNEILDAINYFILNRNSLFLFKKIDSIYGKNIFFDTHWRGRFSRLDNESKNLLFNKQVSNYINIILTSIPEKTNLSEFFKLIIVLNSNKKLKNWVLNVNSKNLEKYLNENIKYFSVHGYYSDINSVSIKIINFYDILHDNKNANKYIDVLKKFGVSDSSIPYFFTRDLSILKHNRINEMLDILNKMGITNKYFDVNNLSELHQLIKNLDLIKSPNFQLFLDQLGYFNIKINSLKKISSALEFFNSSDKNYFTNIRVKELYKKISPYGFKSTSIALTKSALEHYSQIDGLVSTIKIFEKKFKINLISVQEDMSKLKNQNDIFWLLNRNKEYSVLDVFEDIVLNKDDDILFTRDSLDFYDYLKKTFNYKINLFDIKIFILFLKKPNLKNIFYDRYTISKIKEIFNFTNTGIKLILIPHIQSIIPTFSNIKNISKILKLNNLSVENDIFTLLDINSELSDNLILKKVTSVKFMNLLSKLKKSKIYYSYNVKDTKTLVYIMENIRDLNTFCGKEMKMFFENIIGRRYFSLKERVKMYNIYTDSAILKKITSEKFSNLMNILDTKSILPLDSLNIPNMILLSENMKIFNFLDKLNLCCHNDGDSLISAVPSLLKLTDSSAYLYILKYIKFLKYKKLVYKFNFLDAYVWGVIIKKYQNVDDFISAVDNFYNKLKKTHLSINELFIGLVLDDDFILDRKALEKNINSDFKYQMQRYDSSRNAWNTYNDLSRLSIVQLNKINLMKIWFSFLPNTNKIGELIHEDINNYKNTELGLVLEINQFGKVVFSKSIPKGGLWNGSYVMPNDDLQKQSAVLAFGHLHATKTNSSIYSGPSGGVLHDSSDLGTAHINGTDNVVITSISNEEFVVHFYDKNGNVVFIGKYKYSR